MTNEYDDPPQVLTSTADTLAAIPVLLGFFPYRSVVLLAHDDVTGRIGATARTDLELTTTGVPRARCRRAIGEAVRLLRTQGAERMICVVIDDGALTSAMKPVVRVIEEAARGALGPRVDGVAAGRAVGGADIEVADIVFVAELVAGARWVCVHGESGSVPDPQASPAMLSAMVSGRQVLRSRDELVEQVRPMGRGIGIRECRRAAAAQADGDCAELLASVLVAVTAPYGGEHGELTDSCVALLGGALLEMPVRDAAMALGLTVVADEAREVFGELTRRLRGTPRAAAATVLAADAYVRGNGPMVGIALEAALGADRRYRGAHLLAEAFQCGMVPESMAFALGSGIDVARRLGVTMPPVGERMPLVS